MCNISVYSLNEAIALFEELTNSCSTQSGIWNANFEKFVFDINFPENESFQYEQDYNIFSTSPLADIERTFGDKMSFENIRRFCTRFGVGEYEGHKIYSIPFDWIIGFLRKKGYCSKTKTLLFTNKHYS